MVRLARGFVDAITDPVVEQDPEAWLAAYFDVAAGRFAFFEREDGCNVLTREGHLCGNSRAAGLAVCNLHDRLIRQRHPVPDDGAP